MGNLRKRGKLWETEYRKIVYIREWASRKAIAEGERIKRKMLIKIKTLKNKSGYEQYIPHEQLYWWLKWKLISNEILEAKTGDKLTQIKKNWA